MGPRLSTLHDASARTHHQSPVTGNNTDEVQPSVTHAESKHSAYDGSRAAWVSTSRRHVALLDSIRAKTSRPRRAPSKPTVTVGGQAHQRDPRGWRGLVGARPIITVPRHPQRGLPTSEFGRSLFRACHGRWAPRVWLRRRGPLLPPLSKFHQTLAWNSTKDRVPAPGLCEARRPYYRSLGTR